MMYCSDSRGVFLEKNSPVMDARSMPPAGIESKRQRGVWFAKLFSDIVVYGSFVCSAHIIPFSGGVGDGNLRADTAA